MKSWLRQHRQAIAAAFGKLAAQKPAAMLNALVIGIALALPAGGYALLSSLRNVSLGSALEPQLSVFLRPDTARPAAEALGARLKADARLGAVRFVSREQALKELQATEGLAEVVAALSRNPLPDAFVLRPVSADAAQLDALAKELLSMPGVAHVQVDSAWARRLGALAGTARLAVALLATLLAFGLVAITFNTIRLQILTRQDEIAVTRLLGATLPFIRRPFYWFGGLQGLAGGLFAWGIASGLLALLAPTAQRIAETYGTVFSLAGLDPLQSTGLLLFATLLGLAGTSLALGRHLRAA